MTRIGISATLSRFLRRIVTLAPIALMVYSIAVVSYYRPVKAQIGQLAEEVWKTSATVGDLSARVSRNESVVQALQGKVDGLSDRLSRVETTVESINRLTMGSVGGIVLILIERAVVLSGKKRKGEERSGEC